MICSLYQNVSNFSLHLIFHGFCVTLDVQDCIYNKGGHCRNEKKKKEKKNNKENKQKKNKENKQITTLT